MTVTARKPYIGIPADGIEHYHGDQLLYVSWDHHLLFAAPFILCISPSIKFGELLEQVVVPLLAPDPDAAQVDWQHVQWIKDRAPFVPDFSLSLADNGIAHKDLLRFHTPGLNTLCGAQQVSDA